MIPEYNFNALTYRWSGSEENVLKCPEQFDKYIFKARKSELNELS